MPVNTAIPKVLTPEMPVSGLHPVAGPGNGKRIEFVLWSKRIISCLNSEPITVFRIVPAIALVVTAPFALLADFFRGCIYYVFKSNIVAGEPFWIKKRKEEAETKTTTPDCIPEQVYIKDVEQQLLQLKSDLQAGKSGVRAEEKNYSPFIHRFDHFLPSSNERKNLLQDSEKWNSVRKKILDAAHEAAPFILSGKKIAWLTGTNSATLIGIDRVGRSSIGEPALVPTGLLLHHNIVPLTGELRHGLGQHNQNTLSGVLLHFLSSAVRFARRSDFLFKKTDEFSIIQKFRDKTIDELNLYQTYFADRLKIAVLRLLQFGSLNAHEKENIESALLEMKKKYASVARPDSFDKWTQFFPLVGLPVPPDLSPVKRDTHLHKIQRGDLVGINSENGISFGVIREKRDHRYTVIKKATGESLPYDVDSLSFYDDTALKTVLKNSQISAHNNSLFLIKQILTEKERMTYLIDELLELCKTVTPITLTKEQQDSIHTPIPIVFGITNLRGDAHLTPIQSLDDDETGFLGMISMKKDFQLAFTEFEHKERLKKLLSPYGTQVLSFDAAHFIASQHLGFNKYCAFLPDNYYQRI